MDCCAVSYLAIAVSVQGSRLAPVPFWFTGVHCTIQGICLLVVVVLDVLDVWIGQMEGGGGAA